MIATSMIVAFAVAQAQARPLTLVEATDIAIGNNVDVSRANIEAERARLATLRANLERIHASVDASVQELYAGGTSPLGAPFEYKNGILGLANIQGSLEAPLFSGFRVESDIARAEKLERAVTFDIDATRKAVAIAVARAYWSERRLALLEEAQRSSDARLDESERIVLARVNAGLAAGLDKNRAAARRAQLDVQKTSLAAQKSAAAVDLAGVLGIDDDVELVDPLPAADEGAVEAGSVDKLVSQALDVHPELKAAELRGAAVDDEKRAAESGFWPQVTAGVLTQVGNNPSLAGVGSRAVSPSAIPFVGTSANVQAGVTVSMNLFDTYTTTHNVEDAAHRRRLANEDLRAARRQVETGVRVAYAKLTSLREQRVALAKAKAIEADDVEILQHAYERGEVILTELLDAQERLADAERQIVDVDAQLVLARIELDASVGADHADHAGDHNVSNSIEGAK